MNKLLAPALGAAFVLGAPHIAAADSLVQLGQLMVPGMPGYTTENRTLPPGSPGISSMNRPSLPPAYLGPPAAPPPAPYSTRIGGPGELNQAPPELVGPGEPDASGRIGPTADRTRARFAGERGPDGKILPTYVPSQAQAAPSTPQTPPQTQERMRSGQTPPAPQDQMNQMPSDQPGQPGMQRPGSGQMNRSTQSGTGQQMDQTGPSGRTMQRGGTMQQHPSSQRSQSGQMMRSGGRESNATAALNALSAEGYTNISRFERVGNQWQATANKDGRAVTVQVDPQTHQITER